VANNEPPPGSTTVRRAIAFIEQHPDADISVADIAAAANVSIRAVQFAFRRHLDTTPMDYLRTVRLDRAHHDLLTTNPSLGDTIAARWGFHHHSRFAARYRHAYGVTPRHTLGTRLGEPPPAHTGFRFSAGQSPSRRALTSWRPPKSATVPARRRRRSAKGATGR